MQIINSISEKHRLLSLAAPLHPLISVVRIADVHAIEDSIWKKFSLNFYCISLKRNVGSKMKYGQQYYDYDKGVMTFVAPLQVISLDEPPVYAAGDGAGYALFFHPDFLYKHPLASKIKSYDFFSYALNEALHLSEKEEKEIEDLFRKMEDSLQHIDKHTQNILLSQIDLLLNYSNRFYERQFLTRKVANHEILARMERLLNEYFDQPASSMQNPGVDYFASRLNLSAHYLSDVLRSLTGQNAQQHIQQKMIDKAKEYLSTTNLSVAEIAYHLGFEYPQSFNKMFKKKTGISPLQFRQKFN